MFDYFKLGENEQYMFLQLPLMLIKDEQFKALSGDSKILYSLLLNRTSLSIKNNWVDDTGNIYIIYTIDQICDDLNCWEQKAIKSMKELKDIGLVKSVRRGLGKPNLLYVMNFATSLKYPKQSEKDCTSHITSLNCENHNSRVAKITIQEFPESQFKSCENHNQDILTNNKIDFIKIESESTSDNSENLTTDNENDMTMTVDNELHIIDKIINKREKEPHISKTDQSTEIKNSSSKNINNSAKHILPTYDYSTYYEIVKQNIEYSHFQNHSREIDLVNELVNCMLDVICSTGETVKIGKENKPRDMVIAQYLKIDSNDINHIIDRYKEQRHKIKHLHSYLKTMLYTIKQENGFYYVNAVRADGVVW